MADGMLAVAGARLHYEVRGAGPALLMVGGAGGDAGCCNSRSAGRDGAAATLAEQPELFVRTARHRVFLDRNITVQAY
ncbi:hypothetical protein ABT404_39830 [Streptomyces hyaluromycini]|uniref:Uncharacterized protein n=1 Tax=Streptomyces hyaluromycini TaxID=1377993 RepID=A0ABV1X939_9ACTN